MSGSERYPPYRESNKGGKAIKRIMLGMITGPFGVLREFLTRPSRFRVPPFSNVWHALLRRKL